MKPIGAFIALAAILACNGARAQEQEFVYDEALMAVELEPGQALILISIKDDSETPIPGVVVSIEQGRHRPPFSRVSNEEGVVELIIPSGDEYRISFLSLDAEAKSHVERFDIPREDECRYTLDMTYKEPTTKVFVLKGVTFHTGKATLKPSSHKALEPLLQYLKLKPELEIELSGHTDNVGNDDDNQKLSEGRAKSVKKYLVKKGIKDTRITAVGYGEAQPVDTNETKAGRQRNRRTEVRILND